MTEPQYIPCPKCGESMDLRAAWCPMCRRPRSEIEVAEAVRKAEAPVKRRREIFSLVLSLAFVAGAFYAGSRVLASLSATKEARLAAEKAAAAKAKGEVVAAARASAAKAKAEASWTVEGRVYDLADLSPIAGARLRFRDRTSSRNTVVASTDDKGRYRVSLRALKEGGYQLSIRHPVYGDRFLEDISPAFSGQTRQARLDALPLFDSGDILHVPILLGADERSLRHDLVMRRPREP